MCGPAEQLSLHCPPHSPTSANQGSSATWKEKSPEINTIFIRKVLKRGQPRNNLLTRKHREGFSSQATAFQSLVEAPERQIAVINPREARLESTSCIRRREKELQSQSSVSEMVMRILPHWMTVNLKASWKSHCFLLTA